MKITEINSKKIILNTEFAKRYKVYNLPNNNKMIIIEEIKFRSPEIHRHLPCVGREATLILLDTSTTLTYNSLVADQERFLKVYDYNVYLPLKNMIMIVNTEKSFNDCLLAIEKDIEYQIKDLKLKLKHFKYNATN